LPAIKQQNLYYISCCTTFKIGHIVGDTVILLHVQFLQEVKLPQPKLTKELVVVPGYQVGLSAAKQLSLTMIYIALVASIVWFIATSYLLRVWSILGDGPRSSPHTLLNFPC
jgi:hypothetical protein